MQSSRLNDFVVNSKGHCFFCISKISNKELATRWASEESDSSSSSLSSLQTIHYLSRYLKLDMTKVFHQKGSIPPRLLAKVERARLKVNLCEDCTSLTNSFSVLYRQWEQLRLEMESKLRKIEEKMRNEQLRRHSGEDDGLMEVLEALRLEVMEKVSGRVGKPVPQVKIKNLTTKEIRAYIKTTSGIQSRQTTHSSRLGFQTKSDIKMESQNECYNREDDDTGNDFLDDVDSIGGDLGDGDDPMTDTATGMPPANLISESVKEENYETTNANFAPSTSKKAEKENYTIDSKTGKYKCNLCSLEIGTSLGFKFHYESVHLKIRYKCNICGKFFTQKHSYNRHLRSAHLGIRFKCLVCNQEFPRKDVLKLHQRKNNCNPEGQS